MNYFFKSFLFSLIFTISFSYHYAQNNDTASKVEIIAIKNVNIIPMTLDNKVIENANIIIEGNKIISINGIIPNTAKVIDGSGKWLIPGLIDMHVHTLTDGHFNSNYPTKNAALFNTQDIMTPYIVNGVTTIFELNAMAGHFGQRNEILRGEVIGPRMALAALINGGNESGRIANTPADGRQSVRMAKAEGYEFIKTYSQLNIETFNAIIDESNKNNIKVIGHIPNDFRGNLEKALIQNFGMIAHAEEIFKQLENNDNLNIKNAVQLIKDNGTWVSPTLIVIESAIEQSKSLEKLKGLSTLQFVHPLMQSKWITSNNYNKNSTPESIARLEKMIVFNNQFVKELKNAGVPIVAGTDAGTSGIIWGFSLHDELNLLVQAGLTPEEALISATRLPAFWLGIDHIVGTIEIGKFADLILLDSNPLEDIKNTKNISAVCVNGIWINKEKIQKMLSELSNRFTSIKNSYDWKNRSEY